MSSSSSATQVVLTSKADMFRGYREELVRQETNAIMALNARVCVLIGRTYLAETDPPMRFALTHARPGHAPDVLHFTRLQDACACVWAEAARTHASVSLGGRLFDVEVALA
ncbi:MAG: hypothetical protein Q7V62_03715 [Actinomycetota bacterium]|nr:hypothetical protein [Actinomycetota bacterium]